MATIDKKTLEHLAALARIKLDPSEEDALVHDLAKILAHFEELKAVPTEGIAPLTGGTSLRNSFREDDARISTDQGKGKESFHETKRGYLKVPPVFE
jgi:aspartyl-tRNA(Asn)/glutamyl-tRNA(Gln) amidotransferase subunit C